jgi:hypothetical protein
MRASRKAWVAVVALLLSGSALADWRRDYARAERAFKDGNFAEAESLFRQAAREEPEPSDRKRFEGVVYRDYAPQFWAGMAAWRKGDCETALDYWQDSANSAAVLSRIKDFKSQQDRGVSACQQQLAQSAPATAPPAVAAPSTPAVSTPPPTTSPAPTPAPVRKPPVAAPQVAQKPPPVTPAPSAPAIAAPAALVTATQAWFGGRYADVLRVDPASLSDARARAYVHLLRAAARHAEAQLAGTADLTPAAEEIRAARRALSSISPDAAFFSPRFRSFWQATR